jgi:lipopolysaccharide assembly outer membrane protein LptD (OstA)
MTRSIFCLAAILGVAVISGGQGAPTAASSEIKHLDVPMPKGVFRAQALDILRDWNPPIVHLKGNVKVRIYTPAKDPGGAISLQADTVDLDQTTGQITPRGNVRLRVEEIR